MSITGFKVELVNKAEESLLLTDVEDNRLVMVVD
jgi:hypothetical protein